MFDVHDKLVLIVGGAGQIGREISKGFLKQGSKVIVIDTDGAIENFDLGIDFIQYEKMLTLQSCDITNQNNLDLISDGLKSTGSAPSVLINMAHYKGPKDLTPGHSFFSSFERYPLEEWQSTLQTNLTGLYLSCQTFGTLMKKSGGSIINFSSTYGLVSPQHGMYGDSGINIPIGYSTTKAAIIGFTRYLATYWADSRIRVNCITPGGVRNEAQTDEFVSEYIKRTPLGRMAESNEYVGASIFLASNSSAYMTGSNLVIDGGWTAW